MGCSTSRALDRLKRRREKSEFAAYLRESVAAVVELTPYLPRYLLRRLSERGIPQTLPSADRLPAALLLADIDGFTPLTEKLQARGRAGAEEMTDVVRDAFRPAIRAIHRWGGSVVSFGGDALFVMFDGEADAVARAERAAGEIEDLFQSRGSFDTSAGAVRLGVTQAVHHGTVTAMHLGRAERRTFLISGRSVSALARQEKAAGKARLVFSRAARRLLGCAEATPMPEGPTPFPAGAECYLQPHLAPLVGSFDGEFRTPTMVFLETRRAGLPGVQHFVLRLSRRSG